ERSRFDPGAPVSTDLLSATDTAADRELADIARSFRFLFDLTPVNGDSELHRYVGGGVDEPEFVYRPLDDDPDVLEERLRHVDIAAIEDRTLSHLIQQRHRELEIQVEMLRCRGSKEFRALGVELYGAVSPTLLAAATTLLDEI